MKEEEKRVGEQSGPFMNIQEFIEFVLKEHYIETLGGFYDWMKRNGLPKKLTLPQWRNQLRIFLERRV
jgi:antibiotic biosynthesis monooxygenase (ABM) superfamily enzyme